MTRVFEKNLQLVSLKVTLFTAYFNGTFEHYDMTYINDKTACQTGEL
jgi:hypothetical protein